MIEPALMKFVEMCSAERLPSEEQVDSVCTSAGIDRERFYEEIAWFVATQFASNRLLFEDGDAVMNWIFGLSGFDLPELAMQVFLAFDDGEYKRLTDPPDSHSVLMYTRPAIASVIARHLSVRKAVDD